MHSQSVTQLKGTVPQEKQNVHPIHLVVGFFSALSTFFRLFHLHCKLLLDDQLMTKTFIVRELSVTIIFS